MNRYGPLLELAANDSWRLVVAEQDDRRAVVELVRFQVVQQAPNDFIGICDLSVVGRIGREALGRRIRCVRFVEVEEKECARRAGRRSRRR